MIRPLQRSARRAEEETMRILLGTVIGATGMYLWTKTWRTVMWWAFSLGD